MILHTRCPVKARVYLCLIITTLFTVTTWDAYAQPARENVVIGWIDVPPYFHQQASGQPTGFAAEVMLKIAEHAKFDIEFRRYDTIENLFAAVRAGEAHLLPAARTSLFPGLDFSFSAPISQAEMVVVMQRTEVTTKPDLSQIIDKQVGFFSALEAPPRAKQFLDHNIPIPLSLSTDAIVKLLAGDIEALIVDETWITGQLRAAKLTHRVRRIATPVEVTDRAVALHPSRAHLLGAINTAIAELHASGELAELQSIWAMKLPDPVPDVLSVGVFHFPPYQVVNEDNTFTGFAVESLRQLAERANLSLSFKALTRDQLSAGPGPERYDLLPRQVSMMIVCCGWISPSLLMNQAYPCSCAQASIKKSPILMMRQASESSFMQPTPPDRWQNNTADWRSKL